MIDKYYRDLVYNYISYTIENKKLYKILLNKRNIMKALCLSHLYHLLK